MGAIGMVNDFMILSILAHPEYFTKEGWAKFMSECDDLPEVKREWVLALKAVSRLEHIEKALIELQGEGKWN